MLNLIDTHSHLDVPEFEPDRAAVVERARAAGVLRQILPAVDAASWPGLHDVAARYPGLHAAYGLHPTFLAGHVDAHLGELERWLRDEQPLAVGEAGLDYYVEGLDRVRQQQFFEAQLVLARQFNLPVILHARRAVDAVILGIRRCKPPGGVVHSFPGSAEQARQLETLGFKLGFGGPITYPRGRRLRELVATLPLSQLLIEPDSPDQPLCGRQGQRNEPALLAEILATVAELRGRPVEDMAEALNANAVAVFGERLLRSGDSAP